MRCYMIRLMRTEAGGSATLHPLHAELCFSGDDIKRFTLNGFSLNPDDLSHLWLQRGPRPDQELTVRLGVHTLISARNCHNTITHCVSDCLVRGRSYAGGGRVRTARDPSGTDYGHFSW